MGKWDDPIAAAQRASAAAILRQADLELRLLKKLSEAEYELRQLAERRMRAALEYSHELDDADEQTTLLPVRDKRWPA